MADAERRMNKGDTCKFKHVFAPDRPGSISDYYEYDVKKSMGEGSYGVVRKAQVKATGDMRAIKCIQLDSIPNSEALEVEIEVQRNLDHPNIVKLYEVFKDAKMYYLVMEMCDGGELFDRIMDVMKEEGGFSERQVAQYMSQILGAMKYLHSKQYVHRDIKPENFLMQSKAPDAPIKVIDFGLAKSFAPGDPPLKTKAGTPYYVAPEVLKGSYDEKCDVWSVGVVNYILLCGYPPFNGEDDKEILRAVKKGKFSFPEEEWDIISTQAKNFVSAQLVLDPTRRNSAEAMLEMPWLTSELPREGAKLPANISENLQKFSSGPKLKRLALTIIAQQLSDSKIKDLQDMFTALDVNRDGTLTFAEVTDGMKKSGFAVSDDFLDSLQKADTDGSGSIDYTEFIAASLDKARFLQEDLLWGTFCMFDKDSDGSISKEELKLMVEGDTDLHQLDGMVEAMLKEADSDGNGSISYEEFKLLMSRSDDI
eukprot:TRINITY_DN78413_c0_g1_i1.p1 TRINITY_DN78413_c0_g1~~TRINITY_DN78413_c0_g1_i1.p1  ORF type:complete len:497 (+),score=121.14 TRINITY_DN78413_c0_g1_i1:53-1492(+)